MISEHLALTLIWAAWCVVHSVLISRSLTTRLAAAMPRLYSYYRLLYVVFSVVSIAPPLWYQSTVPAVLFFSWPFPWNVLRWLGILAGVAVIYAGARRYDQRVFFGLAQIRSRGKDAAGEKIAFSRSGILGRIRHPYYSGGIVFLLFWGDVTSVTVITRVVLIAYLVIGTVIEERKLLLEYGEEYESYRQSVPMFLPRLRRRK